MSQNYYSQYPNEPESGAKGAKFDLIDTLYKKYLGRELSVDEWKNYWLPNWKNINTSSATNTISNSDEAGTFQAKVDMGEAHPWGWKEGDDETNTTPTDTEVDALTEKQMPGILSAVKSAASQRGGLDTGGYLSSVGNAQSKTWMDAYKALQSGNQFESSIDLQKKAIEDANKSREQGYAVNAATLKAGQPNAWQNILGGAAAGSAFGPWGSVIGGLLGWGAKQGLFG